MQIPDHPKLNQSLNYAPASVRPDLPIARFAVPFGIGIMAGGPLFAGAYEIIAGVRFSDDSFAILVVLSSMLMGWGTASFWATLFALRRYRRALPYRWLYAGVLGMLYSVLPPVGFYLSDRNVISDGSALDLVLRALILLLPAILVFVVTAAAPRQMS